MAELVVPCDQYGNEITATNPEPVALSGSIVANKINFPVVGGQPIFARPGISQGSALSAAPTLSASTVNFKVALNGGAATTVTLTTPTTDTTWAALVADIQTALATAGLTGMMCYYAPSNAAQTSGSLMLVSGTVGSASSVVVTAGTSNDASSTLKIGVANGGTETIGSADVPLAVGFTGRSDVMGGSSAAGTIQLSINSGNASLNLGIPIQAGAVYTFTDILLCNGDKVDGVFSVSSLFSIFRWIGGI